MPNPNYIQAAGGTITLESEKDQEVYALNGLTPEENKIVEDASK